MNIRWVRWGTVVFFLLFVVAVTWPGMLPANRVLPLVLGLPFSMVWIAGWVVLSFLVLVLLDWAEGKARVAGEGLPADGKGFPGPEEKR